MRNWKTYNGHRGRPRAAARRGFTLIEAAMTTVIVGVGFMAMLQLLAAGTKSNLQGIEMTTGMNLAKNIREVTVNKPYTDLMGFNGKVYSPPIDSREIPLTDFAEWTQTVKVEPVNPNCLTVNSGDPTLGALRITVDVKRNQTNVCSVSWYAFNGQ